MSLAGLGLKVDPKRLEGLSGGEREALGRELLALEGELERNPLLAYNNPLLEKLLGREPHEKQLEFHAPLPGGGWPRTRLFLGGNRSGKTTATLVDTIVQLVDAEAVPEHLLKFKRWEPPVFVRVVGPDLTRWLEGAALQKFREWCPRDQLAGGGFARGWDKQQLMLRFRNGSWAQFLSNDQDLDKFAAVALHRVVYDEPPRQDIWGECRMRLIDYRGEELFGLTPTEGMSNWIYDQWYEPWERGELNPQLARLVLVDMDDNPHLSEDAKEWALEGLPPEERDARKTGQFVSFSGLIYPEFATSRHVVPDPDEIPEGVECFEAIDPGMREMAAVVFCYLDFDDVLVVYDELALQGRTISQVCEQIKQKRLEWGRKREDGTVVPVAPRWIVIDPASRNKSAQTGRADQQEYADHGIFTLPGQNDRSAGINRVKERLQADPPRLVVAARCVELRREFKKYRWARPSVRSENDPGPKPVKKDDHLLDALRYACMQRPKAPDRERPKGSDSMKDRILKHHLGRLNRRRPLVDSGFGPGQFA